jgi:competence protein ComEA
VPPLPAEFDGSTVEPRAPAGPTAPADPAPAHLGAADVSPPYAAPTHLTPPSAGPARPTSARAATRAGPAPRRSLLPLALQERLDLDRRAVIGLCVLLLLALGYGVQHFWSGRPEPMAVPVAESSTDPTGGAPRTGGRAVGTVGPQTPVEPGGRPAADVVVDVAGRVRSPGLWTLRPGSRVQDALQAAGGPVPGTDLTGLNLARLVNDGEEIIVGAPAPAPGAAVGAGVPGSGVPLSLNSATVEQLDALPGLGPVLARRVIQYRDQHGGFRSVDQLRQVSGFGERRLKDLRALLRP